MPPSVTGSPGRALRGRDAQRRRGRRHDVLGGEEGPRRAQGRLGRRDAASRRSSADIMAEYRKLAATPGKVARNDGDAAKAIAGAAKKLEAAYEFPYLAHAAMEPMNCVVKLDADSVRGLERRAVPDRRPGRDRASHRAQARAGQAQHAVRRRQLRPPRELRVRLRRRGGVDRRWRSSQRASPASRSSSCGRARTT